MGLQYGNGESIGMLADAQMILFDEPDQIS